ncbi:MAG: hypothetical protein H8K08_13890 [Nitrospira sp.]|nr:hypothetical protein [Nitrospira sp.]
MKRNGIQTLTFSGPALVKGELTYLDSARYADRVVALCFLPSIGLVSTGLIDRQAERFLEIEAALVIVASGARPLHRVWIGHGAKPLTPVLADPCGRLHRTFGVAVVDPARRCHTFVMDRTGVLRLQVSHDFMAQDLTVLQKLIGAFQRTGAAECVPDVGARASCLLV